MEIKPPQSRHSSSETQSETQESSQPEKGKGISDSQDTIESAPTAERIAYLKAIGADLVLNDSELQQAGEDEKKGKSLMDLIAAGQFVGANAEAMQKAKDKYLNDATPGGLEKAKFQLVAESQNVPVEDARNAGINTVKYLLKLKADLELIGEPDSGAVLSNPEIYSRIKKEGLNGVLADYARKNLGLPDTAKGIPLKKLLDGVADAQKNGKDPTKPEYWKKMHHGHGEKVPGAAGNRKGKPEHTPGEHETQAPGSRKPETGKPGGRAVAPVLHSDRGAHPHGPRGKSAFNPIQNPAEDRTSTNRNQPHHETPHRTDSPRKSRTDSTEHPGHHTTPSARRGGGAEGTHHGNTTEGSDDPNGPRQGTNPAGGDATDHRPGAGADQQRGVGVSSPSGKEAHSGGVNTIMSRDQNDDGSVTVIWGHSGEGDGRDGMYVTTYTPNSDGTWNWTVTRFGTGEVVNEGTGNPPDEQYVGSSSQESDSDTGVVTFGTDDESEGRVTEGNYHNPNWNSVLQAEWFRHVVPHITRGQQATDPAPNSVGMHPKGAGKPAATGGSYTDPVDPELQRHGILKPGIRVSHTDQLVHTTESGQHVPRNTPPEDQPQGPSHAKGAGGSKHHESAHRSHQSSHQRTRRTNR